jgi:hypothetical protein
MRRVAAFACWCGGTVEYRRRRGSAVEVAGRVRRLSAGGCAFPQSAAANTQPVSRDRLCARAVAGASYCRGGAARLLDRIGRRSRPHLRRCHDRGGVPHGACHLAWDVLRSAGECLTRPVPAQRRSTDPGGRRRSVAAALRRRAFLDHRAALSHCPQTSPISAAPRRNRPARSA